MNYEELKEALDYTTEHREEVLGESSAILSVVVSKDKNDVMVLVNGNDRLIAGALCLVATKQERLATIIMAAAEMIMAERAKPN